MSGIPLLFAAGVGYYPNAVLGGFVQNYKLIHFAEKVLITYGFLLVIASLYTFYVSMGQRRDSTKHFLPLMVSVFFLASICGFASPFLLVFAQGVFLSFLDWLAGIIGILN